MRLSVEELKERQRVAKQAYQTAARALYDWDRMDTDNPERPVRARYVYDLLIAAGDLFVSYFNDMDPAETATFFRRYFNTPRPGPQQREREHEAFREMQARYKAAEDALMAALEALYDIDHMHRFAAEFSNQEPTSRFLLTGLAILRVSQGLSQGQLAEALGVSEGAVRHTESGRTSISLARFYEWVRACGAYAHIDIIPYEWNTSTDNAIFSTLRGMDLEARDDLLRLADQWGRLDPRVRKGVLYMLGSLFEGIEGLATQARREHDEH